MLKRLVGFVCGTFAARDPWANVGGHFVGEYRTQVDSIATGLNALGDHVTSAFDPRLRRAVLRRGTTVVASVEMFGEAEEGVNQTIVRTKLPASERRLFVDLLPRVEFINVEPAQG